MRTPVIVRADSQRASQLAQKARRFSWDEADERSVSKSNIMMLLLVSDTNFI